MPPSSARRRRLRHFRMRQILVDLVRQARNGQRLQPHRAGTGQLREEKPIAAEDHVFDAGNHGDLEADRRLERAYVAGMHAQHFAGREVLLDELAGELEPRRAHAANALQQESIAAKDARAERLLKSQRDGDLRRGAQKAVPVHQILLPLAELDGHNVAGDFGGKRHRAGILERRGTRS